jgi:hypothetical protein
MPRGNGLKPNIWEQMTKSERHCSPVETRLATSPGRASKHEIFR